MIIRAGLLETALVKLLSALAIISVERAEAIFYSSQNNKARIDLIASLIPTSKLSDEQQSKIRKALDKVLSIAQRRNLLVHGEWEFKKDKFIVREKKSLATKSQDPIETFASIETLATEYYSTSLIVEGLAQRVRETIAA